MPSGSASFDINQDGYEIDGTISWTLSGDTITWVASYTTYEYIIWNNTERAYVYQGLSNTSVRLTADGKSVSNSNQFSGRSFGTHSNRTSAGWIKCKTGTLQTTTTLRTGSISATITIVKPGKSFTYSVTLAWPVTYDGNEATSGSNAGQTKVIDTNLVLSNCGFVRTGYVFTGWNTAADGSGVDYETEAVYTNNAGLTLYAQWEIVVYSITYDGNGNTGGTTESQTKSYNETIQLQPNGFTRVNYVFLHWNTKSDDSGSTYNPGYEYSVNADLILYAIWKRANIPVFVNPDGTIHQVEKAFINLNDEIKQCTVYTNPDGTIRELV